jgi:hypothetical protein
MNKWLKYLFVIWFANEPEKATKFAARAFLYYVIFSVVVVVIALIAWSE